jgi:S1-C subfamily serine protease
MPVTSNAQETSRRKFVNQTKDELISLDGTKAFTQSRCSLDLNMMTPGMIIARRVNPTSALELGDRIVGLAGKPLIPATVVALRDALTAISPDATVEVDIVRDGQPLTVTVQCRDSLPSYSLTRKALQAATESNFKGCVSAINEQEEQFGVSPGEDWLRYNCAYHAGYLKNPAEWVMAYYNYLDRTIEYVRWDSKELANVRAVVLANRSFFEDRRQLALYQELQSQLDSAVNVNMPSSGGTPPASKAPIVKSAGTGFFVSPDGLIVTSAHVVADAKTIRIHTSSGVAADARFVAASEATDIAILQADVKPGRFLSLAAPRSVAVGTPVFTYGWPVADILGVEPKFTDGSISALSGIAGEQTYLQITVPVQPGNSGGPLVNDAGQVVGIIASQAAIAPFLKRTGTLPQSINWAVKAEYAALLIDLPTSQSVASNRAAAISMVRDAICFIEVSR